MLKSMILAVAVLSLSTGVALAGGEGNGDPFPFSGGQAEADVPTDVTQMTGQSPKTPPGYLPARSPARVAALRQYMSVPVTPGDVLPTGGSEASVQTANSLPRSFEVGTAPYEQAQSLQRYLAMQSAGQRQRAYTQAPQSGRPGTHG